jgi:hypothetical protein
MAALEAFTRQNVLRAIPQSIIVMDGASGNTTTREIPNPVTPTRLLIANEMRRDQQLARKKETDELAKQQHDLHVAWSYSNKVEISHPRVHANTRRKTLYDDQGREYTALVWDDTIKPLSHTEQHLHDFYLYKAPLVLKPTSAYVSSIY